MHKPIIIHNPGHTIQHDPGFYVVRQENLEVGTLHVGEPNAVGTIIETWSLEDTYSPPPNRESIEFKAKPNGTATGKTVIIVECTCGSPPEETGLGGDAAVKVLFAPGIYYLLQDQALGTPPAVTTVEVGRLVVEPVVLPTRKLVQHWYLYQEGTTSAGGSGRPRQPYQYPGMLADITTQYRRSDDYRPTRPTDVLPAGSPPATYVRGEEVVFQGSGPLKPL